MGSLKKNDLAKDFLKIKYAGKWVQAYYNLKRDVKSLLGLIKPHLEVCVKNLLSLTAVPYTNNSAALPTTLVVI